MCQLVGYSAPSITHGGAVTWKRFLYYWPFGAGIHWSPVESQRPVMRGFDDFLDVSVNTLLNKQLRRRWLYTPWRSYGATNVTSIQSDGEEDYRQTYFLECELLTFCHQWRQSCQIDDLLFSVLWSHWQYVSIGSDNGLSPHRGRVIVWSNDDTFHWLVYMRLPDLSEFIDWNLD